MGSGSLFHITSISRIFTEFSGQISHSYTSSCGIQTGNLVRVYRHRPQRSDWCRDWQQLERPCCDQLPLSIHSVVAFCSASIHIQHTHLHTRTTHLYTLARIHCAVLLLRLWSAPGAKLYRDSLSISGAFSLASTQASHASHRILREPT